jgi:hypothetical protein
MGVPLVEHLGIEVVKFWYSEGDDNDLGLSRTRLLALALALALALTPSWVMRSA